MTEFWCEHAWLGGEEAYAGVVIGVEGERIVTVRVGVAEAPEGAVVLHGSTIPGLANAHSHAFQRAFRGKTEVGRGTFWTWRERMYEAAARLDPDNYFALARATFGEMALAGVTGVGEFHYVHHAPDGTPYEDPNAMGEAVIAAAAEVGIRITLIDACYLHGGIGEELSDGQRRFSDGSVERWAERMDALADGASRRAGSPPSASATGPTVRVGAAIHSVRAVAPEEMAVVAAWARERGVPLHAHVSEQPAENEACLAAYGRTPTELLAEAGALSDAFTAIHVTHPSDHDRELLGSAGATVCLCPTTERNLADGIGPASELRQAGARLAVGSDSQAVIDLFEEARAIELDERLMRLERGNQDAAALLAAATVNGQRAIGWPEAGAIERGKLADFVNLAVDSVRLAGIAPETAAASLVFAATAADVTNVIVGGEFIVRDGAHVRLDVEAELWGSIGKLGGGRRMTTLAIDNIGLLITNDPGLGDGPLGELRDAAVVFEGGKVVAVERAGVEADGRVDAGGRCVMPGFVDSHTHLVFAGDRAAEFAARMAGADYEAGGIRVTAEATRAASAVELERLAQERRAEGLRAGITHVEIKSGYGLDVAAEAKSCEVAAKLTDDVTFLGAHVVPAEFESDPDAYVALVCGEMLDACAPRCRWIDAFCETGAFTAEQCRAVLEAGRAAGLGLRLHGNQLGPGEGVRLAVELEAASVDHCTYLSDADVEALAGSRTVATFLPATDFSTRQPYPDARRVLDAGATVALATNTNPGSSNTTSMGFCIALAVRDMGMTVEEAVRAGTRGGAEALRRDDLGRLAPGSRADAIVLDATSPTDFVYRPGVPLVRETFVAGRTAWSAAER